MAMCNETGVNKELEAIAEDTPVGQLHVNESYELSQFSHFATQSKTNWSEEKKAFSAKGERRRHSAEGTNDTEEDLEDDGTKEEVLIKEELKSENRDEFEFKLEFVEEKNPSAEEFVMDQDINKELEQKYQPTSSSSSNSSNFNVSSFQPQNALWILPHDTEGFEAPPTDDCESGIGTNENNKIRSPSLSEESHTDRTIGNFVFTQNVSNSKEKFEISSTSTSVVLKSKKISRKNQPQSESARSPQTTSRATDKAHKTQIYSCKICNKKFTVKDSLNSHTQRIHDRITRYECYFCNNRFFSLTQLFTHIRRHTKEQPFACCICGSRFAHDGNLNSHIKRIHEGIKSLKCTFKDCKYQCTRQRDIIIHTRTHTGERPFKCDTCESKFKTNRTLNTHIRTVHQKNTAFKCTYNGCVYRTTDKWRLKTHMIVHSQKTPFQCVKCKSLFKLRDYLTRHNKKINCQPVALNSDVKSEITSTTKSVGIGTDQTQKFSCKICGRTFSLKSTLSKHTKVVHERVTRYECYFCFKRVFSLGYLFTHIRGHIKEQPFTCCICGLKFTYQNTLSSHIKISHKDTKCFKCTFKNCQQRFFLKRDLTRHLKTHSTTF